MVRQIDPDDERSARGARMKSLRQRLADGETILADGAMGTMLLQRGYRLGECPELFNLERVEVLEEIARLYLEAGAQIVQTNTFGGSPLRLAEFGLADRYDEINCAAVEAVRRVVAQDALICASVGPCGVRFRADNAADVTAVKASFGLQAQALVRAGVDAICIETMFDIVEASAAVQAVREVSSDLCILVCMTFDPTPRGYQTFTGTSIAEAVRELQHAGADVIGSNCGNGIEPMLEIARELRRHCSVPLVIRANAGLPQIGDGETVYPESPEMMAAQIPALVDAGVQIIGGCCGTSPAHIKAFARALGR